MKVISLLVTNFKNDNRVHRMAKSLSLHGFSTTVVAWKKGSVVERENYKGVEVERVIVSADRWRRANLIVGAIQYFEFALRVVSRYRKADLWHCNDYEAFVIGVLAKMTRPKLKLVYDCHELESHRDGKGPFLRFLIRTIEKLFIPWTELLITISPSIKEFYMRTYKLPFVALVRNVPNEMHVVHSDTLREKLGLSENQKIFLYQGMLDKGRGVEMLLNAFDARKDSDAVIVFMGFGPFTGMVESFATRKDNIFFVPAVSYEEIPLYTGSADVGVNSTQPVCLNNLYCLPNKLFEYIQSEIPVLTNPLPDCAALVNEYQVGRVIPFWNVNGINDVIDDMLKEDLSLYQDRLKAAKKILNWEVEEQVLISAYNTIPNAGSH
jgi:glycosyltransferase involved in cell wall biosynthesis